MNRTRNTRAWNYIQYEHALAGRPSYNFYRILPPPPRFIIIVRSYYYYSILDKHDTRPGHVEIVLETLQCVRYTRGYRSVSLRGVLKYLNRRVVQCGKPRKKVPIKIRNSNGQYHGRRAPKILSSVNRHTDPSQAAAAGDLFDRVRFPTRARSGSRKRQISSILLQSDTLA